MNELEKRVIDISYEQGLSHIGSCLTAVNIIDEIYMKKKEDERFVLSSGHAHLAHLVVKEKYEDFEIGKVHDIHCNLEDGCDVATGSLGQGLPIALGMAMANPNKKVYCLISDGECSEGSIWEALRVWDEYKVYNLEVHVNLNGWGAYKEIDAWKLSRQLDWYPVTIHLTDVKKYGFKGQEAHYETLTKERYEEITQK